MWPWSGRLCRPQAGGSRIRAAVPGDRRPPARLRPVLGRLRRPSGCGARLTDLAVSPGPSSNWGQQGATPKPIPARTLGAHPAAGGVGGAAKLAKVMRRFPMSSRPTAAAADTIEVGGDLTVNRIGFGAMRITGTGIWGDPPDRERAREALLRAVELDVNFIDTADSYGPEVSEILIAETLYPYPDELVIATKGGLVRPGPGRWEPDGRPEHLRQACEGSLKRLKLDQIPLYQFHRPDPDVPLAESIGALAELKGEGKIRHIGVSNVTEAQFHAAEKVTPIVSIQNRYNVADRSSETIVDLCEQEQVAFRSEERR